MTNPAESKKDKILRQDFLTEKSLSNENMVTNLPLLKYWEPERNILLGLEKGISVAIGTQGWNGVKNALPDYNSKDISEFSIGLINGVRIAIDDFITDHVNIIRNSLYAIIKFYSFIGDIDIWIEISKIWIANGDIRNLIVYIKDAYPDLYLALLTFPKLLNKLETFIKYLLDITQKKRTIWSIALDQISEWVFDLFITIGHMLKPSIDDIITNRGNPKIQGEIIGKKVGRAIIEAIFIVLDLYAFFKGAIAFSKGIVFEAKSIITNTELSKASYKIEKISTGITTMGKEVAGATKETIKIYEDLATDIRSYKKLKRKTGSFNQNIREIFSIKETNTEFVEIQLDAHHIVENTWYSKFSKDFEKIFNWKSADEMDAISIHSSWHRRSGDGLATNLKLLGAEKEPSLSVKLQKFLAEKQIGPNKESIPFKDLNELFQAHELFYKEYCPRYSNRLDDWFKTAFQKIKDSNN